MRRSLDILAKEKAALELGLDGGLWVGVVDGLVNADEPEEVILDNAEVEKEAVSVPGKTTDHGAGNSVQDEVVGRCHDSSEDESWIRHAEDDNSDTLPGARSKTIDRKGGDRETNKQGISEVERRHGSYVG